MTDPGISGEMAVFASRTIDVPSMFIAGSQDWGVYQVPGAFEKMRDSVCTRMEAAHLLEGAGHWVQQEQAGQVTALLLGFLAGRT
jgi:pimeloyl-ACP methyl ester carboxylesterase